VTAVTLRRDGTSVDIDLLSDSGGTPLITRSVGKPEQTLTDRSGSLNPRSQDFRAGLETVTLVGRFVSDTAYADARALAGLVKEQQGGTALTLAVPHGEFPDSMSVVPASGQEEAVSMSFLPGTVTDVQVEASFTRIDSARGTASRESDIPTSAGSGPVQLTDGTNSVAFETGVEIEWSLGQPNCVVRSATTRPLPYVVQKNKAAYEAFSINWEHTSDAVSNINTIVDDLVSPQLGRDTITLDFQGEFGLGSFDVVPVGGSALRHQRVAGEAGVTNVPSLSLRRVLSS
jgi:hypothetical protein